MKKIIFLVMITIFACFASFLAYKVVLAQTITASSSLETAQTSVALNTSFPVSIKVIPTNPFTAQVFSIRINFDSTKLRVDTNGINYSSPWVLSDGAGGDGNDTIDRVNNTHTITLVGAIQDPSGTPLNTSGNVLASVTFKAISQGSSNIEVVSGDSSAIAGVDTQSYRVFPVPVSRSSLSVTGGVVSTPTPTLTPSTGLVVYELRATNPPACVTAASAPPDNSQISFKGRPGTVTTAPGVTRTGFWVNVSANSNFGNDYYQVLITDSRSPASIPPDTSWSVRLKDFNHVSGSGPFLLSPGTTYYFRVTTNGTQHYFGGDIATGEPFPTAPSFTVAQCSASPTPTPSPTAAPGQPRQPTVTSSTGCGDNTFNSTFDATISSNISPSIPPAAPVTLTFNVVGGDSNVSEGFSGSSISKSFRELGFRRWNPGNYRVKICYTASSGGELCSNSSQGFDVPVCASPSPTTGPAACVPKNGDANGDGVVDLKDFNIWWRESHGFSSAQTANFNCIGGVDQDDLTIWETYYRSP